MKDSKQKLLGVGNSVGLREGRNLFFLDFMSVREEKGFIGLCYLNLCCLPNEVHRRAIPEHNQHHVLGAAKRGLLVSISLIHCPISHGAAESVTCDKSYRSVATCSENT